MTEPLRPLTLGEILDRTSQLYRRNFKLLAGIAAVPTSMLVAGFMLAGIFLVPLAIESKRGHGPNTVAMVLAGIIFLVAALLAIAATVISQAGITRAAVDLCNGQKLTIRETLAAVRPRFWRYLWLMVVQGLLAVGVPGGAAAAIIAVSSYFISRVGGGSNDLTLGLFTFGVFLAAVVAAVFLALEFSMALAASVVEDKPAWPSIRRAMHLSKGTRGRIFATLLIVWAVFCALSMVGYIPVLIIAAIVGATGHGSASAFIGLGIAEIVDVLLNFALQTIIVPAYIVPLVLFYFDQRIRREGYDIERMMQQAGLAVPEISAANLPSMPLPDPATVKEP